MTTEHWMILALSAAALYEARVLRRRIRQLEELASGWQKRAEELQAGDKG